MPSLPVERERRFQHLTSVNEALGGAFFAVRCWSRAVETKQARLPARFRLFVSSRSGFGLLFSELSTALLVGAGQSAVAQLLIATCSQTVNLR